jgi:hypothetical protein
MRDVLCYNPTGNMFSETDEGYADKIHNINLG